ncbi:MAG TPA: hypothetical protein GXZ90_09070 [Clostridiales bacterium]|nr:hypothetical protein [Clostridiales bacterium]
MDKGAKMDKCLCGEEFNKYKWKCISIRNDTKNEHGWEQYGVSKYSFLYACPKCETIKMKQ